jgi:hypothetical protein
VCSTICSRQKECPLLIIQLKIPNQFLFLFKKKFFQSIVYQNHHLKNLNNASIMHRFWECRYTHRAWDYTQEIVYELVNKAKTIPAGIGFLLFPPCSHQVHNGFSTYIEDTWVERERERLEHILFGTFQSLNFFKRKLWWANQRCPLQKKNNWTLGVPTTNHNFTQPDHNETLPTLWTMVTTLDTKQNQKLKEEFHTTLAQV